MSWEPFGCLCWGVFPCDYTAAVCGNMSQKRKMTHSCLMNGEIISWLQASTDKKQNIIHEAESKRGSVRHHEITTGIQSGSHGAEKRVIPLLQGLYSLIRKTDGVSVSSPALSGLMVALCMDACMCVYMTGGKWRRICCVSVARVEETPATKCTCTQQGVHCVRNTPQKLSCIQFSLLHPLSSFILSTPFIYLYPSPQQPLSLSSLFPLFSPLRAPENTPAVYLALHSAWRTQTKQRHKN